MKLSEIGFGGQRPVDGYGSGGFRVGDIWHEGSLLLSPAGIEPLHMPPEEAGLARLAALAPEIDVLLIGQGAEIAPLPARIRARLEEAGIGVEIMSTPSACRTYNVLLAEERRVAALLTAL